MRPFVPPTIPVGSKCCWHSQRMKVFKLQHTASLSGWKHVWNASTVLPIRFHTLDIAVRSPSFTCISNSLFFLESRIHMKSKPKITCLYSFPTTLVQNSTEPLKTRLWVLRHTTKQTCEKLCPLKDFNPRFVFVNRKVTTILHLIYEGWLKIIQRHGLTY